MRSAREPDESEWLPTDDPGVWYIPDPPEPEATPAEERMSPAPPPEPKEPPAPRPAAPRAEPPAVPRVPTATEQWEMPEDAAHWGQSEAPEEDVMGRPNAPGLTPVEMASFTVRRTGRDAFDNVAATLRELVAQEAARWIQAARQEATWP
jgi:outer membrane biosynthesis protein TonB